MSKLQLFVPGEYSLEVRTILFDWYVCGEVRLLPFELWWGRGEASGTTLKNLTLTPKTLADGTNLNGKEIVNNAWFQVAVGSGIAQGVGSNGLNLGNFAIGGSLSLTLGLQTSNATDTVGPVFFRLDFSCDDGPLFYADFQYGAETYGVNDIDSREGLTDMNPILVSATLFDLDTYVQMSELGFQFPKDS